MASEWHYAKDGVNLGPVPSQRLKELAVSGELSPSDLVWKDGLPEWRPASTLKGLFSEDQPKPAGPPPLPTAKSLAQPQPALEAVNLDAPSTAMSPAAEPTAPTPQRKPDIFDRARDLAQKAKAKAEAFQKEARARAERAQQEAKANPNPAEAAITRGAKAAVDYARSDEAKELARKTRDTVKGGALAASALVGAASVEGRERVRKAAEHPLGVGAALLFFFPLGLYLVWHHPHWTQTRKWAWTGAWLGVFFLMLLPAMMMPRSRPTGYGAGGYPEAGPGTSPAADRSASGVAGYSGGKLASFEDHPPPIVESLSNGREVWLLDGCRTDTLKRAAGDRHAIYVVLAGSDLACVVAKEYDPSILEKEGGFTRWQKFPPGESGSGGVRWTWGGRKEKAAEFDVSAEEVMVLTVREEYKGTNKLATGAHPESSSGASISLRRDGAEVRWKLEATSSVSLVGGKGATLPPTVLTRGDSGSGRRLRSGE